MSPQLYSLTQGLQNFMKRHHPVVVITLICILLGAAIYMLVLVQLEGLNSSQPPASTITGFDKTTVEKIKSLQESEEQDTKELKFPSPRSNPFSEQ